MLYKHIKNIKPNSSLLLISCELPINRFKEAGYKISYDISDLDKVDYVILGDLYSIDEFYFLKFIKTKSSKVILISDERCLYKTLMTEKFTINHFNVINSLLEKNSLSNCRIALETMSRLKWGIDKFYLAEIYNNYYHEIISSKRNCSSNVQAFCRLFLYKIYTSIYKISDYYDLNLIKSKEHSEYVINKNKEDLKEEIHKILDRYNLECKDFNFNISKKRLKIKKEDVNLKFDYSKASFEY